MHAAGSAQPSGDLGLRVIRSHRTDLDHPAKELSLREIMHYGLPRKDQSEDVQVWKTKNLPHLLRGTRRVLTARGLRMAHVYGQLWLKVIKADGREFDLGLVSQRVVTTAGMNAVVDAFQNTVELENFKFHGLGTGSTAEASGDTALVTELTTEYNPNSTRATGSTVEGGSANVFRTVGTNTVDATAALREHGIFTQAATGGGTLLDRSVFALVTLEANDALQSTYDITFAAGG